MIKSIKAKFSWSSWLLISFALFFCLSGCGGSKDGDTDTDPDTTTTAASLTISASSTTVSSDNSDSTTLTVTAIDSSSALVPDLAINMTTDTGILGAATITTDATGKATVTFAAGSSPINRTATITATSGTISALIPIQIVGSTVTLASSGSTLTDDGLSSITVTVTTKKNSAGTLASGAAVALTATGGGGVTITPSTGTTNASGQFTATVTGTAAGTVNITAAALGTTATTGDIIITAVAASFFIDQQTLCNPTCAVIANETITAIKIGNTLNIRVHAPPSVTQVTFATSIGAWDGGSSKVVTKTVSGGNADATLATTQAGVASIQAYDNAHPATYDTLTVAMSSGAAPAKIFLQAAPTVVPISVGSTTGSSTLTATVSDADNYPLGGQPVAFEIVDGTSTSGGETITPVVVMTATTSSGGLSVGQARATFTSGSMPSAGTGVKIRAYVVGTTAPEVRTGLSPSGNDVAIVIGGLAGSIAFGQATVVGVDSTTANYTWKMSVLVSDSNGNAVPGAVVSLGVRPIAWSTGPACSIDADSYDDFNDDINILTPSSDDWPTGTADGIIDPTTFGKGTFWNEDDNENLILDAGEDGKRCYYADPNKANCVPSPGGTKDGLITPTNSAGGSLPSSVTTDENGVAGFTLTYPKQSALWTIDRIRATTIVQGTETRSEIILRLPALSDDVSPTCRLGNSPYTF